MSSRETPLSPPSQQQSTPVAPRSVDRDGFVPESGGNFETLSTTPVKELSAAAALEARRTELRREEKWWAMLEDWTNVVQERNLLVKRVRKGVPDCLRGAFAWPRLPSARATPIRGREGSPSHPPSFLVVCPDVRHCLAETCCISVQRRAGYWKIPRAASHAGTDAGGKHRAAAAMRKQSWHSHPSQCLVVAAGDFKRHQPHLPDTRLLS